MFEIMNDSEIEINDKKIRIKEYKGYRVVTFADIDAVHGRPEGTAKRNFNKNKERFIEGEDFFVLELTEYEIRTQFGAGKNAGRTLILITESGYLMLVKSFTDELSWTVQRQLVKSYFRVREITVSDNAILLQIIKNQMSLESKIDTLQKGIKISNEKINILEKEIRTLDKKVDTVDKKSDNILKTLFDMSRDVISNGMQIIYNKFFPDGK